MGSEICIRDGGWAVLARACADAAPPVIDSDQSISGGLHRWAVAAITAGQGNGELRHDVDADSAAWLVARVLMGVPQYVLARFDIDPGRVAVDRSPTHRPAIAPAVDRDSPAPGPPLAPAAARPPLGRLCGCPE